jgi:hypothetical protein
LFSRCLCSPVFDSAARARLGVWLPRKERRSDFLRPGFVAAESLDSC